MLVLARGVHSRTTIVVPPTDKPMEIVVFVDSVAYLTTAHPVVRLGFTAPREVSILRDEAAVREPAKKVT